MGSTTATVWVSSQLDLNRRNGEHGINLVSL